MRVGIIQSNYLPWRGYFDFIRTVDLFIFNDDLQFTKRDWRNRNRIKTPNGAQWITVPVHYAHTAQLISDTKIDQSKDWKRDHRNLISTNYSAAPYVRTALAILDAAYAHGDRTISELNIRLVRLICNYLGISTPFGMSSDYSVSGSKTERLLALIKASGATTYLSGPNASAYLDVSLFSRNGISLEFKSYDYEKYPQLWGDFRGDVTILDLIANCGDESRKLLTSRTSNALVYGAGSTGS